MSKLIFRSNYFKNEPAVHRSNYIKYLGTREGVEMNPDTMPRFFFEDQDMHGKKENYIDYISGRPGVALNEGEQHGLFSYPGAKIQLEQVMDEVANHKGTVWINVVSMKREDAQRLGYENISAWQNLVWRHINDLSSNFSIEPDNLQWYAAFHNESHHPHIHLVVYSKDEREGFLRKGGLKNLKSSFTNDIFGDELQLMYSAKTEWRNQLKEQARQSLLHSLHKLDKCNIDNPTIEPMVSELGEHLKNIKGKKVYGYLHKNIKDEVDRIVDELGKIPEVKECYERWIEYQNIIKGYYHDENDQTIPQSWNNTIPLSRNAEFKSIKNMIIREAIHQSEIQMSESAPTLMKDGYMQAISGHSSDKSGHLIDENGHSTGNESEMFYTAKSAGHLAKQLESIFSRLIGDVKGNNQAITESRDKQKENEKKIALGQRVDDSESNENKKYMTM